MASRLAHLILVVACVAVCLACDRGSGEAPAAAAPIAANGTEEPGADGGERGDASGLPPQIAAEHPVPSPGAPGAARSGDAVSFLEGTGMEARGPSPELHVAVADPGASAAFYEGVLGFAVEAAVPAEPPYRRVELAREGVRIVLRRAADLAAELPPAPADDTEDAGTNEPLEPAVAPEGSGAQAARARPSSALHLPAADLDALLRRVEQAGTGTARLDDGSDGSRRLSVRTPDGQVLVFVESLGPDPDD